MAIKVIVELRAKPGQRAKLRSLLESVEAKHGPDAPGFLGSTRYEVLDNPDILVEIADDCFRFLATDKRSYDLIVCDPPTFSNSKRMARSSFAVDRDHPELIHACLARLASGGTLIFSTNSRGFKLEKTALPRGFTAQELTPQTIPEDFRNDKIHRCWRIEK